MRRTAKTPGWDTDARDRPRRGATQRAAIVVLTRALDKKITF
jgi:hypothetical protein